VEIITIYTDGYSVSTLAILWKYINGKPCRDYLHLNGNIAYREYYELEVK